MTELMHYVIKHTERGECHCGQCMDAGNKEDPKGHVANLGFFKVAAIDANKEEFVRLTKSHNGEFCAVDPFDGKEHSYMELGAWIGDQGLAMQYMGLGTILGVFELLSPSILGIAEDDPMFMQLCGAGLLTVKAASSPAPASPPSL